MCGSAQKVRNIRGRDASTRICAHTLIERDPDAIAWPTIVRNRAESFPERRIHLSNGDL